VTDGTPPPPPRYEALAAARQRILSAAANRIPLVSVAGQARALGLWDGRRAAPGDEAQLALLLDLGVLDPVGGHTRGLDRQAKAAPPEPDGDDARVLAALREARFGLWRILGPHPEGGARLAPLAAAPGDGEGEVQVMDRGLVQAPPGAFAAARLMRPAGAAFAMTCGAVCALDARVVERLLLDVAPGRGPVLPGPPAADDAAAMARLLAAPAARLRLAALGQEPGFAARAYRHAIDLGLMGPVPGRTPGVSAAPEGAAGAPTPPGGRPR
jgi:hypothetical protein